MVKASSFIETSNQQHRVVVPPVMALLPKPAEDAEDKRLSSAMKHFYGKKARTREEFSSSKNIEEVELTPRLNMSVFCGGSNKVNKLDVISE